MAPSVEITNVAAGVTRWIAFPISPGDIAWRDPVLAPQGTYLAWMEVAKANMRKFTACMTISGTDGAPADPGPGRVKILDFATGRVLLNRATTIATSPCASHPGSSQPGRTRPGHDLH